MPIESDLTDSICAWFRRTYGHNALMLVHEEVRGKGGRRPDMLVVVSPLDQVSLDDVIMIPVEIESSTHGAIHDPRNGLRQLHKYPGHMKYLAIPETVARHEAAFEIPTRCERWGAGLLVVNHGSGEVSRVVAPKQQPATRTLRAYPIATERWIALRKSSDVFRRISGQRVIERA